MSEFGDELRRQMTSRHIGVRELARLVPCNAGYISNLRSGHKKPSLQVAARIDALLSAGGKLVDLARHDSLQQGQALATRRDAAAVTALSPAPSVMSPGLGTRHGSAALNAAVGFTADAEGLAMEAAHESSDRAARDIARAAPGAGISQLRKDVYRLARTCSEMPPLVFLMESKRARDLAFWMMERTGRPRQLAELYLLTGQICALMSVASFDLAAWPAAVEQAHAAAAYAELADHRSLEAWAHGMQALTANWCGRAREAVALTDAALSIAPSGTARARLYSISARAWAHLGVAAATREALALAGRERDSIGEGSGDELHDVIGGQFGWGPARQAMSSASALLLIGDSSQAADCAREAIRLGARDRAGSVVGMSARADLARAELAGGRLDAAGEALRPVWGLAPEHRRYGLVERLHGVAGALTRSPFTGAPEAAVLAERIEVFEADSAPRSRLSGLGGSLLPGGE